MFEYLMPLLVMPTYENTLLDQTYRARRRAADRLRPRSAACRGASPSRATTPIDAHLNYQYRAFGVPGLGLKRGLADDLVIAPYASALALMVAPGGGVREPAAAGRRRAAPGAYGFYEAIDYTPSRLPRGQDERHGALVHGAPPGHEPAVAGATCCSTGRCSAASRPTRASRRPMLLLQERVPRAGRVPPARAPSASTRARPPSGRRRRCACFTTPDTPAPEVQLLSNGRYHVMVTNAGGGYSRWRDLAVTRWREDAHPRPLGQLLLPARRGERRRSGRPRTSRRCKRGRAATRRSSPRRRAEFRRRDHDIETHTEICVSPEDDIELRRAAHHQPRRTRAHASS